MAAKVMPHLSGGRWVGEASASLSKGRLKSPLPRLSEGLPAKNGCLRNPSEGVKKLGESVERRYL